MTVDGLKRGAAGAWCRLGLLEWCLLGATLALYLAAVRPFFGLTADDAYISFRYAQSFAAGCGLRYNCGQPPVEGYTNFLWTVLSAIAIVLRLDVVPTMRVVGLLCGLGALVAAALVCRSVHRGRPAMLVPLVALGSCPFWAVNAVAGLETLGATLSVIVAAHLSLGLPDRRRPWLPGVAWGVSFLVRPEALALAALTALYSLGGGLRRELGWRQSLLGTLRFGLAFLAVAGPYFLWRAIYYGALLPNSFYAKNEPLWRVLPRNLEILGEHPVFLLGVLLSATVVLVTARRGEHLYLFLLALACIAISLSVHNNFWMPGHRLYLTPIALLLIVAGGVADWGLAAPGGGCRAAALGTLVTLFLGCNWANIAGTRQLAELHYARANHPARALARHIREQTQRGEWIAMRDAGFVPYYVGPRIHVLDIHDRSLNDRHIARQGWDVRYVLEHSPRFVVLVSGEGRRFLVPHLVEAELLLTPAFTRRYRHVMTTPWNPYRHFFLFMRRG